MTLSGTIDGSGAFKKSGPGALTVTGANTFSGSLTVADGLLSVAAINPAGAAATRQLREVTAPGVPFVFQHTRAGVDTEKAQMMAFVICGVCSALSGVFYAFKLKSAVPTVGNSLGLMAIASVALGGASISSPPLPCFFVSVSAG